MDFIFENWNNFLQGKEIENVEYFLISEATYDDGTLVEEEFEFYEPLDEENLQERQTEFGDGVRRAEEVERRR